MLHDLRYSLRMMRVHPWFSAALVAALALGIGANTAVFTLVNAVLFKPLPFDGGERIVAIFHRNAAQSQERVPISYPDYLEYREQTSTFESLEASMNGNVAVSDEGNPPELYRMSRVTAGFFDMLGVRPVVGRGFAPGDAETGAGPVIVLSHSVWRDRFGQAPDVVGRSVRAGNELATVIGVMPEGFGFPNSQQVWLPLVESEQLRDRAQRNLMLIGKRAPGVSRDQARADLDVVAQRLAADHPDNEGLRASVSTFHELQNDGPIRVVFIMLQGAVGFVLLVACANVANMMLSRALGRTREMSVRAAMGASRWRMLRQPLAEAVLLSLLGGAAGLVIALFAVQAFDAAVANVGKPSWILFEMDYFVFVYFAAACVVSALLFGLVPGLHASRVDLNSALKEGSRDSGSRRGGLLSGALVVLQFMLAVVLLAGAGMFVRGLVEQRASLEGLPAADVLSAIIQLPQDRYPDDAARIRFFDELLARLEGTPGLRQAALASNLPAGGGPRRGVARLPRAARRADTDGPVFRSARRLRRPGFDHRDRRFRRASVARPAGARQTSAPLLGAGAAEWRRRCRSAAATRQMAHGRRCFRRSQASAARAAAVAGVLRSVRSGRLLGHGRRAAREWQSRRADGAAASGSAGDRPRSRLGEPADARGRRLPARVVPARVRQHVPDLRGRCVAAGVDRDLRGRCTNDGSAHAGDRTAHGARRYVARHRAARREARSQAARARHHARYCARARAHSANGRASVRRLAERSARVRLGRRDHRPRRSRGVLAAGASRSQARSAAGAAARLARAPSAPNSRNCPIAPVA
jgi:hypothetical protein